MNGQTPPTIIATDDRGGVMLDFDWSAYGVDRPRTGGILVGREHVARVRAANAAGVLWGPATIATDVNGKTYVAADLKIMGRHLNADLRRLGF